MTKTTLLHTGWIEKDVMGAVVEPSPVFSKEVGRTTRWMDDR